MRRGKPFVQRDLAALVQRAHGRREWLLASVALVEARTMGLALHQRRFTNHATVRAEAPVLPNPRFKPFAGGGFVSEDRIGKVSHGNPPNLMRIYVM